VDDSLQTGGACTGSPLRVRELPVRSHDPKEALALPLGALVAAHGQWAMSSLWLAAAQLASSSGPSLDGVPGSGVGSEGKAFVCFQGHGLEHEVEQADSGVAVGLRPVRCSRTS
jgi:hypothetical protein